MDSHSSAGRTDDPPSQSRFSSNNPFRSRRRTNTVSSLKPAAEAPRPQPQSQPLQNQQHKSQTQDEKRSGKRHTHHLHGHSIFSRRRLSAWDAAPTTSPTASSTAATEMDSAEHQSKRPSRRMTLTTSRPFVHSENVPLPSLPAQYRSHDLANYNGPSSASFAHLTYDPVSPPSTAPGSTAAPVSHRRGTTSSRPTTTGEGGSASTTRRFRDTRNASVAATPDAPFLIPISFDDFHNRISIDGCQSITGDADMNDHNHNSSNYRMTHGGNGNVTSDTELDSPDLHSTFHMPAVYEETPTPAHGSPSMNATDTMVGGNTHASSNYHNNIHNSSHNHHLSNAANSTTTTSRSSPSTARRGSIARTSANIRTSRNPNVAALSSGLTRHDSNASSSTSTTSRTTNSNNATNSPSHHHPQSHLHIQRSASNLAGSSASPVSSRLTVRQGRGMATSSAGMSAGANPSSTTTGAGGASAGHTRPPRKSIGPGVLTSTQPSTYDIGSGDGASKYPIKRRPSLARRKSGDVARTLREIEHSGSNGNGNSNSNGTGINDMPDFLVSGPSRSNLRAHKAVSMFPSHQHSRQQDQQYQQNPPGSSSSSSHRHHFHQLQSRNPFKHAINENIDPLKTTSAAASSSNTQPNDEPLRSPGGNGKHTPTAKRMSMVPPHHTGLGARTISPTDVRKIKRMSVVSASSQGGIGTVDPNAPPTPHLDDFPSHLLSHAPTSPNIGGSANSYGNITATVNSPSAGTAGYDKNSLGIATTTASSNATPALNMPAGSGAAATTSTTPSVLRPRSSASVSMIPRKSTTPSRSSSRTTPDPSRKSFSNGGNLSAANRHSGSSCGGAGSGLGVAYSTPTLRDGNGFYASGYASGNGNGTGTSSSRLSQNYPSSRLPTPKGRGGNDVSVVATSGADEEEVPPVPAIPKVYGSPRPSVDQQYASNSIGRAITGYDHTPNFSTRKASLPFDSLTRGLSTPIQSASSPFTPVSHTKSTYGDDYGDETPTAASSAAAAAAAASANERTHSLHADYKASQSPVSRNRLQPLKLPPLNLAPLSGSIARHIDALRHKSGKKGIPSEHMPMTPPPPLQHPRTPTTPMTASKATFCVNREVEPEVPRTAHITRSTSTRFGSPLTREISAGESSRKTNNTDEHSATTADCDAGGGGDENNDYEDSIRQNDNSVSGAPEIPGTFPAFSGSGASYSPLLPEEKGTPTPSVSSSLPRPPATGGYNTRATANTAKVAGPRPLSHHPSSLSKPRTADDNSSSINNGSESITPRATKHDSTPATHKIGSAVTFSGKAPTIAPVPRGSPASKPASLHIRRRSAGGTLAVANGRGSDGGNGAGVNVRAPSMGNHPALVATSGHGAAGGMSPDSRTSGPVHQLTHRSSPAGMHSRAGVAGARSVSTSGKLRPVDHAIDKEDLAAEEEMRKLGHKRRDFEAQARSLDELRRRAEPKERATPAQALRFADLNIFEKGEIIDFKEIYFTGTDKAKKHVGDLHASAANFGYDDDRGDYNIVLGDHLAYRYEVVDVLGKGSFGQVVRCIDHKTGGLVAVKIIRNKKRFHQQALVEVNLLSKLKEWDPQRKHSVVNFTQSFYFRGHLCISTELLGMNLYELIKAHDFKGFSLRIIRRFTKQILSTLVLLHQHKVIHCDLKPENILLAHPLRTEIKTIDFGSSCFENEKVYTYIQSRFYRSPEVILGMSYGMPIDMWSLGCIMAELYTGYPIFPGENEQEQLACIMEIFGPPERHLIEKSSRRKLFFDSSGKPRTMVSSKGRRRRPSSKDLRTALKCDDEAFLDFVARCLRWDPGRRMNPIDALSHEFITGVKAPTPRARQYASSSSIKRSLTSRPLPEPPGASKAPTSSIRSVNNHASISSPSKFSRRPSGVHANLTAGGPGSSRRLTGAASSGNLIGSSLPRVTPRSVSGKPDLASTAAAASLAS